MKNAWYHCGRCGSLFESPLGLDEERLCSECGRKPVTGIWPAEDVISKESQKEQPAFEKRGHALDENGKRAVRKKRGKNTMMRIVVIWVIIMLLAVWNRQRHQRASTDREARFEAGKGNLAEGTRADERVALMIKALPDCHRALAGFLTGGTPEIRNQFVANPIETAAKMANFYRNNPFPHVEIEKLKRIGQEPILVGDEWMIETRWQSSEGIAFDAVFRREGSAWKLDWEHFSRYSEYPWALFLAGAGSDEAEFRLLARNVAEGDQAERVGSRLRFVLMSPVFGVAGETGMESPELVVDRRSNEGLLLEAAFQAKSEGAKLFGGTMVPMEPEGLVRVRVRIKRGEFGGLRSFTLEKVVAGHWLGVDESGFDLEKLKDDLFTGN